MFFIENLKAFQLFSTHRPCVPYISPQRDRRTGEKDFKVTSISNTQYGCTNKH